jgi:nucleotide-binding universal stress UspA family protein
MTIAKIIAPMTGGKRDACVLETAIAAARPFNAHVVALLVHPDPRLTVPYMGTPLSPQIVQNLVDVATQLNRETAQAVRSTLERVASGAGIAVVERPQKSQAVTCSYCETEGIFADRVARAAQLSDLVVFGPVATVDTPEVSEAFVEILLKTDRPVLISAKAPARLATKVALAWDGRAAASHAVMSALPFLHRATSVVIFHVTSESKPDDAGAPVWHRAHIRELTEYLGLQGVNCSTQIVERGAKSTGEALLDAALHAGCDLLIMGGYGHSHLRETIFGGVTAHIRWHAELPVLMVH